MRPHIFLLLLLVLLSVRCASTGRTFCNELTARYTGTGSYPLTESLVFDGLTSQLLTFKDSISHDTVAYLWKNYQNLLSESSTDTGTPTIENISALASMIKYRGYTIATQQPDTYESIYALSKLPLLIWVLIIHHKNKDSFITDREPTFDKTALLSPYAEDMKLHLIKNIEKSNETYSVVTYDNITFSGLANDNCNAQVITGSGEASARYFQIVDCFFVSSLPLMEIEEHIAEWYTQTPYTYVKPNIRKF